MVFFYIRYKANKKAGMDDKKALITSARETAFKLIMWAENKFKTQPGEFKFKFVMNAFLKLLPPNSNIREILEGDSVDKWLQDRFDELKDFLDDGIINDSIPKT
jgi:hypothetical protein